MYMIRKEGETKLRYRLTFEIELFRLLAGVRFLSSASLNSTFSVVIFFPVCFVFIFKSIYVSSVPSLTILPPGIFLKGRMPHLSSTKKVQKPDPGAEKSF